MFSNSGGHHTEDMSQSPPLVSGDNSLSLLSIASALRRGSPLDDDMKTVKGSPKNNTNAEKQLSELNINDTMNEMSDLSLKRKSETLQSIGNRLANSGLYVEAIRYYSKAIALYDEDYRLYCNRSYCYERVMKFEDSLADALRSVILMPTKPKPYFRQGKALIGLKRYSDAEKAFNKILQMNGKCEDTNKELLKTRYLTLRDHGLDVEEASLVAISHDSIESAIKAYEEKRMAITGSDRQMNGSYDSNLAIIDHNNSHHSNQLNYSLRQWVPTDKQFLPYSSNNRFRRSQSRPPGRVSHSYINTSQLSNTNGGIGGGLLSAKCPQFMHKRSHSVDNVFRAKKIDNTFGKRLKANENRLPKNLFGYKGLWIGNVSPDCKPSLLRSIFMKYGPLDYVNVVPQSYCAFVNYHNDNSPRVAIAALFGQTIVGVSNGFRPLVFRFIPSNDQKDLHYMRPYQPRGTNECYFWRTTGCKDFNCPLLHYPMCRGIDFQPWMNKKYHKKCS